ncbi:DUF3189 family protein [Orenia marismortui]|uniref:Uncharacterized protein DUF3189 n=1 Tax=Orenia marismortui TaxID=46469 RepID=A0A4R8H0H0_9FIRM|nr:DUF3189 family protein [Orenia marismortui]TDX52898.1 uncharacterized protein DUF3189 [Orenia marismortui]
MKVIYYCYGSAHSSVLAAAIHTNMLPTSEVPDKNSIYNLPHYDKTNSKQIGTPFYYGEDEFNNQVYVLGMGSKRILVKDVLLGFLEISNINHSELILVDALPYVKFLTKVGGVLSRRLGVISIGRYLTTYTLQSVYYKYIDLVSEVKKRLIEIDS